MVGEKMAEAGLFTTGRKQFVVDKRPQCQGLPFVLTDAAHPRLVLKYANQFLVLDQSALIPACNTLGYGFYSYDTRHISQWDMYLDDMPLSLLSSTIDDGYAGSFLYTNPQTDTLPQQKVTILREVVLGDALYERITFENFHHKPVGFVFKLRFQSDFADMFEVRGLNRPQRGDRMMPVASDDGSSLYLGYKGLDGALLETQIEFHQTHPDTISDDCVLFKVNLPVRQKQTLEMRISCRIDGHLSGVDDNKITFEQAQSESQERFKTWSGNATTIATGSWVFDSLLERGRRDIYMLRQPTPKGYGLGAGVPWYCAVFGRDSAITGWQVLPYMPELSRECISVLAAYQGQVTNQFRAEQPGRIMHEIRFGELARGGKIPHTPYYGTVDATQLWIYLLCKYVQWTGDLDFARDLWPQVKLAVSWLDKMTADGFISYMRVSEQGLENQGWKDSGDSVTHHDGALARPPIAICEAQAYLYAARVELAGLAELLGHKAIAKKLRGQAAELKIEFAKQFWMEEEQFIAIALDGQGRKVGSVSSNPGHCLFTGILDDDKAQIVARRLMGEDFNSGWGIRTLAGSASAFNPISYHNGSIWPHDNAIIAEGFRKLGRVSDVHKIMRGLLEVAQCEPDFRLPELFCGFDRIKSAAPIDYPVSCSPQAWAAGSMFQLLSACVNFQPDAVNKRLHIVEPSLPKWLGNVEMRNIRVGQAEVDLAFNSYNGGTACQILRKSGNVKVVIES